MDEYQLVQQVAWIECQRVKIKIRLILSTYEPAWLLQCLGRDDTEKCQYDEPATETLRPDGNPVISIDDASYD
ncbi:hypothetical protein M404DRAFT_992317 [Pisolithus tinctorius Marx 270]|uniref:Uncharacterized protein n=1 Tax=Pisolithus tinctorius Marx 270 TaxID=870435 RepID=A0A0C3KX17_PISTI|nr:hypothetical protein M404DRAFT_992317 [Pisolithus tinctorius Marx 270]